MKSMKKILNIQLNSSHTRPVFNLQVTEDIDIDCMLDTGADMPVWCL